MIFLTPEQRNAARQSFGHGRWSEGVRIAVAPLHSSLYRLRKRIVRATVEVVSHSSAYRAASRTASVEPIFTAEIHPLFFTSRIASQTDTGLDQLFADVDKQIEGIFRLAGADYRRIDLNSNLHFSEAEDQHAFERLYWIARYARASAFGHLGAGAALRSSWQKWLQAERSPAAFAPYTLAERIASLSETLFWMGLEPNALGPSGGPRQRQIIAIKRQIWQDATRLSSNIEYSLGVHNHLLNDARGLFRASRVFADHTGAAQWQQQSFGLWDELFPKLVLEDGSFAEQSSHYHLLLCRTAIEYFLAARGAQRELPAGTAALLAKMFCLANDLLRRDGSLPRFGDNSPDHTAKDLWGLMAAAYELGLLQSPPRHEAVTPLTLFYCRQVTRIGLPLQSLTSAFYPQGGFMFPRSHDDSLELAIHTDPRAEAHAHGDSGRGSFELCWRGNVIVREPGSFLSGTDPRSAWSRSGEAQNVTCLNGLPPAITGEARKLLPAGYGNHGGEWVEYRDGQAAVRWDGFRRIHPDITLWRSWKFDEAGDLFFEERIDGGGTVQLASRLCLGDGQWTLLPTASGCELGFTGQDGSAFSMHINLPSGVKATLRDGLSLPEFGSPQHSPLLILRGKVKLPISWTIQWRFCGVTHEPTTELLQQCAE